MMAILGETQPKSGGGGGGISREDVVYEKCGELLEKSPDDFKVDDYKVKIKKLGGLGIPLNIFLFQEIQVLQAVIAKTKFQSLSLQQAIKGEVVMTQELQNALNDIFDAKVPHPWTWTLGGDEFSWVSPTLGLWFSILLERYQQNNTWLNTTRPNSFWMTGFSNAQGFLTAMTQEVTRKHKQDAWALDDVIYHTEVTDFDGAAQVKSKPAEGVYIHGLFLDGCAWSKGDGSLVESEPKVLFCPLPVLYVTGTTKKGRAESLKNNLYGPYGPFECPLYKYPARTGRYYIAMISLATKDADGQPAKNPDHWILRGVALLCSTD